MKLWQRIGYTEVAYQGWRSIIKKTFAHPDGRNVTVDILKDQGPGDSGVIALTPAGEVIVVRQFRCGPELVMDEIIGGGIDEGETPEEAALRELREEAGYKPGTMEYLGLVYRDAWKETPSHYFLATDCTPLPEGPQPDGFEVIEVDKITIAELISIAKNGRMTDAGGVLLAYDKLKELEKKYEKTD